MNSNLRKKDMVNFVSSKEIGIFFILLFLCFILSFISPQFLSLSNLINVLRQTSLVAIGAAGMTFVIISGGIDLSIGSILGFSSMVAAIIMNSNGNPWIAILVGLLCGAILGLINGLFISLFKLQPFIVTLCMMIVLRGTIYIFTGGNSIYNFSETFRFLGNGNCFSIPFPIILMFIIYLLTFFLMRNTKVGRFIYAIGDSEKSSIVYGIPYRKYKTIAYTISGIFAAFAGLILAARLDAFTATAGQNYELEVIAAVVVGGTRLSGGEGSVWGSLIGALILGIIKNGLNLLLVSQSFQQITIGLLLLLVVAFDGLRKEIS